MSSDSSTPSPSASSSLEDATHVDAPEVNIEDGAVPSTFTTPVLPSNGIDIINSLQNNPAFQALLSSTCGVGENANLAMSKLLEAYSSVTAGKQEFDTQMTDRMKNARLKVYCNGYFLTFDKTSSCKTKQFWRCEFKNTCKARIHTDLLCKKLSERIHEHNHTPPSPEEVKLYGLDPDGMVKDRVYLVNNQADPNQRRKIRKQVAEKEAAAKRLGQQQAEERQKQQNAEYARVAYAQEVQDDSLPTFSAAAASPLQSTSATTPVTSHGMLPFLENDGVKIEVAEAYEMTSSSMSIVSNMSGVSDSLTLPEDNYSRSLPERSSLNREASEMLNDYDDIRRHPMYEDILEIVRTQKKLLRREPNGFPRTNIFPTRHFEFYLSKYDEADEHSYDLMRIETRDETHLINALQKFCGEVCIETLFLRVSLKMNVVISQSMICNWDNHQFFLLDTSNPKRWRLMYVDDKAG